MTTTTTIALDRLDDNPYNTRLAYDEARVAAIAQSIAAHGLLQPPMARPTADGRYQLAFGHTRLRAYRQLATTDPAYAIMPVVVRDDLTDEVMAVHAWAENNARKDLTAYEEAAALDRARTAFGWSQREIAERFGLDRSTVANKLRLLKLPQESLDGLQAGTLSERQAVALLPILELPEALRTARHTCWIGAAGLEIKQLDDFFAYAGRIESGTLRTVVQRCIEQRTTPLQDAPWATVAYAQPGIVSPTCSDCPIRIKSSNRCPNDRCTNLKQTLHRAGIAAAAGAALGLPHSGAKLSYGDYDDLAGVALDAVRRETNRRACPQLSVVVLEHSWGGHRVPDHPGCMVVCAHGQGKRCACKAAVIRTQPDGGKLASEKATKDRIKADILRPAITSLSAALDPARADLWRWLLRKWSYGAASAIPSSATPAEVVAAVAKAMVEGDLNAHLSYTPDYDQARRSAETLLRAAGAAVPWAVPDAAGQLETLPDGDGDPLYRWRVGAQVTAWGRSRTFAEEERDSGRLWSVVADPDAVARRLLAAARAFAAIPIAAAYLDQAEAAIWQIADFAVRGDLLREHGAVMAVCAQTGGVSGVAPQAEVPACT